MTTTVKITLNRPTLEEWTEMTKEDMRITRQMLHEAPTKLAAIEAREAAEGRRRAVTND